jgi:uncharacterized membrane protein
MILSIIGIGLASYIIYVQFYNPPTTLCYVNAKVNCNAVFFGVSSKVLGIPTPFYGMAGYIMILFSNILKKPVVSFGAALFGFLFCLRLILIEIFQLGEYCPICMLCQTLMISIMISSFLLMRSGKLVNSQEEIAS